MKRRHSTTQRRQVGRILPGVAQVLCLMSLAAVALAQQEPAPPREYFEGLVESANVRFEFYDPRREPHRHRGFTTYQLGISHHYGFRYDWVEFDDGGRRVTIRPKLKEITYTLENKVRLPRSLETDRRWSDPLVHHEFDHVAMTIDPRPRMLVEHLYRQLGPLARRVGGEAILDRSWGEAVVEEALRPRREAVLNLLLANEDLLDEATRHGAVRLKDRRAFFQGLFSEENLRRQQFPYLPEVRKLVRRRDYRQAKLPYRLIE